MHGNTKCHPRWNLRPKASCPLKVRGNQGDFECSFQKTKWNSWLIFSIFDTTTPAWLNRSAHNIISCLIQNCVRWARDRHVFTALRIITNHTRFCWAYECNDQSEVFRWVIAKMPVFSSLDRWLNTSFWLILSSEITKCKYVYVFVYDIFISQCKQLQWF